MAEVKPEDSGKKEGDEIKAKATKGQKRKPAAEKPSEPAKKKSKVGASNKKADEKEGEGECHLLH